MRLRELELDEFRSFRRLLLEIAPEGFRAIGPNASGKSTLLEAIAMLATTRSPRTSSEREIPHWQSGVDLAVPPYARVRGTVARGDGSHTIEIGMSLDERGHGSLRKQIRFDDQPVRAVDAVGQLKTVLFSPTDVDLIAGPPAGRRRYLDMAISQASRSYLRALSRYGRVLEQRNSLLRGFARERVSANSPRAHEELAFWDAELAAIAAEVLAQRIGAVSALARRARSYYQMLTGDATLDVTYATSRIPAPGIETGDDWQTPAQNLRQTLLASVTAALSAARGEELRRGVTAVGPHRDDFAVFANGVDLSRFGSRGQQRLAVIAIKLGELELLDAAAGEAPVLLLDDVLSELDKRHRKEVIAMLASRQAQICVTATDQADLASDALAHLPMLRIYPGGIERLDGR